MSSGRNDAWQADVRRLLSEYFGVEDIALRLRCGVEDVREEVRILRESGLLARIYERNEG